MAGGGRGGAGVGGGGLGGGGGEDQKKLTSLRNSTGRVLSSFHKAQTNPLVLIVW